MKHSDAGAPVPSCRTVGKNNPPSSAILDHVDRRIRRYIRAKQQLITLLEEQKQAIIHQAVTGQIDVRTGKPYPAYKALWRVEWLGDVPETLDVVKRFAIDILAQCHIRSRCLTPRRPESPGQDHSVAPNHIRSSTGEIVHLETAQRRQGADSGKYEVSSDEQERYHSQDPTELLVCEGRELPPCDCFGRSERTMYPIQTVR